MDWKNVLKYEKDIRSIALRWARKYDPDLYEDAVHHCMIKLKETVDVSQSIGPEREYVRGAIWNIVNKYFASTQQSWDTVSLDKLSDTGVQLDEDGNTRWPKSIDYSGPYKTNE